MLRSGYRELNRRYRALSFGWRWFSIFGGLMLAYGVRTAIAMPYVTHSIGHLLAVGGIAFGCVGLVVIAVSFAVRADG